jgi:F-type H+-transporting ATPase subunit delta
MGELARRYAAACYDLSPDEPGFSAAANYVADCAPLRRTLEDPTIDWREKIRVLDQLPVLAEKPLLRNFFRLLVKKGRIRLLGEIAKEFRSLDLEKQNAALCRMTCVQVPDPARLEQIKAALCQRHHRSRVLLEIRQDPALLGGFTLEMDGVTYDHSVRGSLRNLTRQLQERRII